MSDVTVTPRRPPRADPSSRAAPSPRAPSAVESRIRAVEDRMHAARAAIAGRFARRANLVVEVGCGTGRLLSDIADGGMDRGFGLDPDPEAVEEAARHAAAAGHANLAFAVADPVAAARDHDPPGLVDLVILSGTVRDDAASQAQLVAWTRRIGPWGRILVFAVNARGPAAWLGRIGGTAPGEGLTPARLAAMAERAGLVARRLHPVPLAPATPAGGRAAARLARWLGGMRVPGLAAGFAMTLTRPGRSIVPLRASLHGQISS